MNSKNTLSIILTIAIILGVSIAYFALGNQNKGMKEETNPAIYEGITFKAAYSEEGHLKIFALAKNNALAMYETSEGNPLPEQGTVVIGFEEANMMKEEKLFTKPGDQINDLFGVDFVVEGVLKKTSSPIDDFHFVSETSFAQVKGDENTIFVKLNEEQMPKMFYNYPLNRNTPLKLTLTEGNIDDYKTQKTEDKTYYPLIIGFKEAAMMKEEKLFSKPGDKIEGLFGQNFVVAGIIAETNTSLDMMHLVPLTESELN
ncbi:MAG: hypothetical protein ACP5N3_05650 [Candidatus Nanoarchaeia archaeon]